MTIEMPKLSKIFLVVALLLSALQFIVVKQSLAPAARPI